MYVVNANSHQKIPAQQITHAKKELYCVAAGGDCHGDGCQNEDPNKNDMVNICDNVDDRNIFDFLNNYIYL